MAKSPDLAKKPQVRAFRHSPQTGIDTRHMLPNEPLGGAKRSELY